MKTSNSFKILAFIVLAACFFESCTKLPHPEDAVIRIVANGPLEAQFGKEVNWSFKADMNGRALKIVDISSSRLPFGVGIAKDGNNLVIKGIVEGRQFRSGQITAVAFDEKGCKLALESTAKVAAQNAPKNGAPTDLAIPFQECDPSKFQGMPQGRENFYYGKFSWQLMDGVDHLETADYAAFFKSIACFDQANCPKGVFQNLDVARREIKNKLAKRVSGDETIFQIMIPPVESTNTTYAVLGECAKNDRKFCGRSKDCLWTGSVCVSGKTTGLTPKTESKKL
jgi:hypothetical protein